MHDTPVDERVTTYVPIVRQIPASSAKNNTYSSRVPNNAVFTTNPLAALGNDGINHGADEDTSQDNTELYGSASDVSCPVRDITMLVVPVTEPSRLPINSHPMVTRAKVRVFKPKALTIEVTKFEARTIEEAFAMEEWRAVAQAKCDALLQNHTWELVSLPSRRKVIGCKWLFKVKRDLDSSIARRKGRLIVKECSQVPGCDFKETFNPVVKPTMI